MHFQVQKRYFLIPHLKGELSNTFKATGFSLSQSRYGTPCDMGSLIFLQESINTDTNVS